MLPLQAPPPIPDAGTLDRIIGPFGALVLAVIMLFAAGYAIWKLVQGRQEREAAWSDKLNALHETNAAKLTELVRDSIKGDIETTALLREVLAVVKARPQ